MNVELSTLKDGGVLLVNDGSIPDLLKRVEFYEEQKLMTFVYHDNNRQPDLMEYEVPEDMLETVSHSPDVIIFTTFEDHDPIGYKVPLIKVGDIY